MLCMLIAWNDAREVVATKDCVVVHDPDTGDLIGLVDFEAIEKSGGSLRDVWVNSEAIGSGTWPEWLLIKDREFKVELDDNKRITALVHKSRVKRKRSDIEAEIARRMDANAKEAKRRGDEMRALAKAKGLPKNVVDAMPDPAPEPTDLRDLLGGPDRPLVLDEAGRTRPRPAKSQRPNLPIVAVGKG